MSQPYDPTEYKFPPLIPGVPCLSTMVGENIYLLVKLSAVQIPEFCRRIHEVSELSFEVVQLPLVPDELYARILLDEAPVTGALALSVYEDDLCDIVPQEAIFTGLVEKFGRI